MLASRSLSDECDKRKIERRLSVTASLLCMLRNPEVESFFAGLSVHSDVAEELAAALQRLGEYEVVRGSSGDYSALYAVTSQLAFCGASGMRDTYWRLRPSDVATALASGAEASGPSSEWVKIVCFRSDWPDPDLAYWALRAYDYARTGA